MGLKRITNARQLYEVASIGKCLINCNSDGTVILIQLHETTYDKYIISKRVYNKLYSDGVFWPSNLQNILLDFLKHIAFDSS
jgi:hypothetical protein